MTFIRFFRSLSLGERLVVLAMLKAELIAHTDNKKKLEIINELINILSIREHIDYSSLTSTNNDSISIEELSALNEEKDIEVKSLQRAWEDLEGLLFNDLQITLQEKNQLTTIVGNMRKQEKQKKKNRGRSSTQVWRAD